mmetsp:Transcript_3083/g.10272  ORF Transcript_3083/g.10272 Transcript_3083/m.10272 type:complete len:349 (+) Transcript_3083:118-1164(+)
MARSSRDSPAFVALVQATAGAAGGVFASFVLMPLEVVKTRIQIGLSGETSTLGTAREILQAEGPAGLFCGVSTKCLETGSKNFIYFYVYDALNALAKRRAKMTTIRKLALGYVAGVVNATATMPLEVLATRMQAEAAGSTSPGAMLQEILRVDGVSGLFRGFWFNVVLCVNPAIQNTVFDTLKAVVLRVRRRAQQRPALAALEAFALGAFAKAVASTVTFPLVRVKTMLQAGKEPVVQEPSEEVVSGSNQAFGRSTSGSSVSEMLHALASPPKAAPTGRRPLLLQLAQLYRGLGSTLAKSVLQAALLYMTKDQVEGIVVKVFKVSARAFFRRDGRLKLGAWSGRPLAS